MTTPNRNIKWSLVGDGVTTVFAFDNLIFAATDIAVYLDGVLQGTGYSVAIVGQAGTVTFDVAPAAAVDVVLKSAIPADQLADFVNGQGFDADGAVEASFDRMIRVAQQNTGALDFCLRLADGDPAASLGRLPLLSTLLNSYIGIDGAGNPVGLAAPADTTAVAVYWATVLLTADETAAHAALGLGDLAVQARADIQNQAFSYATAVAGTANAVTATFSPTLTALTEGMRLALKVGTTNTGAVTLNPDGLGATAVKKNDGATALEADDWTAGQIVEVEYDGANFQMVSGGGGGGLVLLASASPAAAASADIPDAIVAGYKKFLLVFDNLIPAVDGDDLWLRTSTDNGVSFDTGAGDYGWGRRELKGHSTPVETLYGDQFDAQIVLAGSVGSASDEGVSGEIWLSDPLNAAVQTRMSWAASFVNSGLYTYSAAGAAERDAAEDVDAVQLLFSTGNIASGEIRLYGLKEA